jgi:tRNA U38,U39,U40 pseudouridine synthase TruA
MDKCFGEERINIPKAPALGLLLERVSVAHIANIQKLQ